MCRFGYRLLHLRFEVQRFPFFFFFHTFEGVIWLLFMHYSRTIAVFVNFSTVNSAPVHCSQTHKFYFSTIFSLKIGHTALFTHLKIILLQCFQFSIFNFSKINSIQTDHIKVDNTIIELFDQPILFFFFFLSTMRALPPIANLVTRPLKACSIRACKPKKLSLLTTVKLNMCNLTIHEVVKKNYFFNLSHTLLSSSHTLSFYFLLLY